MATLQTKLRLKRNQIDPSMVPNGTQSVGTSSVVATKWQIDFTNPVTLVALPVDFTVAGAAPTSAAQNTPTRITLTYTTPVATGQAWVIPNRSVNVRSYTGGYVAAAAGTF